MPQSRYSAIRESQCFAPPDRRAPIGAGLSGAPSVPGRNHIVSSVMRQRRATHLTPHDDLTGLLTPQAFTEALVRRLANAPKDTAPFSLILFEIVDCDAIAMTCGRDVECELLKQLATLAQHCLRGQDILARWNDHRFAALLPDARFDDALHQGERLRKRVAQTRLLGLPTRLELSVVEYHFEHAAGVMIAKAEQALRETRRGDHTNTSLTRRHIAC
ncbi:diguanylate cyclase [Pistricoccus aurantiacus]|uniref:diguanylate cyclase n=1 Tax=Pistricoccus aurantiacus TaxID=1883414 RepID=A0A5B8STS2_9GAMM|nr:diguanylate cyclase [Pistricoccus aurantiacus]QEA39711.1 diguanylate cyclase [Pistricoccus aurantiacus]